MTDERVTDELVAELQTLRSAVQRQEQRLAAQEAELQRLRTTIAPGPAATGAPMEQVTTDRRRFLRLVGATAVGAAGTMVAMAPAASAVDTDPLLVGETIVTTAGSTAATALDYTAAAPRAPDGNTNAIFAVTEGPANDLFTTAILGVAGVNVVDAVAGATSSPNGTGVIGFAPDGVGVAGLSHTGIAVIGLSTDNADIVAIGSGVIGLNPHLAVLPPTAGSYITGDIARDQGGNLFVCVQGGSPGSWRRLAGPATAGAFSAISPQRVYDSRATTKIGTNEERVITVGVTATGTPVVPTGALAVAITLTVTETEDVGGFLSVRPAGTPYANTSSINWFGPGQNIATTVLSALGGDRQLVVRAFNRTHFLIDVAGYYG
jgi:hypothetical protein